MFKGLLLEVLSGAVTAVILELKNEIDTSSRPKADKEALKAGIDLVRTRLHEEVSTRL